MGTKKTIVTYRFAIVICIIAGVIGIALLLSQDFDLLTFLITTAALGGLIGGRNTYAEADRQRLQQSFKPAFEWLLLVVLAAFAVIAWSEWLGMGERIVLFLNAHWPSFVISAMCLLMGIAGFQNTIGEGSA